MQDGNEYSHHLLSQTLQLKWGFQVYQLYKRPNA